MTEGEKIHPLWRREQSYSFSGFAVVAGDDGSFNCAPLRTGAKVDRRLEIFFDHAEKSEASLRQIWEFIDWIWQKNVQ